ncbi:MAG: hypothetical protein LBK75_03870 [Oscillospiraceae bacterium]|jgi:hypothetical protein|nr:hypothetical protein [Oscillospiraceae bacterium]
MTITNSAVLHKKFGQGTVISQDNAIVTVRFSNEYGDKRFQYPNAFVSFLTLCDEDLKRGMDAEIGQIREAERLTQQKCDAEADRKREAERSAILEARRASAKKKTPAKAKSKPTTKAMSGGDGIV